ncbi:unnamed protein product [Choristocarpus tenellus]
MSLRASAISRTRIFRDCTIPCRTALVYRVPGLWSIRQRDWPGTHSHFLVGLIQVARRTLRSSVNADSFLPDVCGLPVMTSSWDAIKSLDKAYMEYANGTGDPYKHALKALDADSSCIMAHCIRGLLAATTGENPVAVTDALAAAKAHLPPLEGQGRDKGKLVESVPAVGPAVTAGGGEGGVIFAYREHVFVKALESWASGQYRKGALVLETWLMKWPVDLMALKFAQDAHIILGDSTNARDCVGRVLPYWNKCKPFFGYA